MKNESNLNLKSNVELKLYNRYEHSFIYFLMIAVYGYILLLLYLGYALKSFFVQLLLTFW